MQLPIIDLLPEISRLLLLTGDIAFIELLTTDILVDVKVVH